MHVEKNQKGERRKKERKPNNCNITILKPTMQIPSPPHSFLELPWTFLPWVESKTTISTALFLSLGAETQKKCSKSGNTQTSLKELETKEKQKGQEEITYPNLQINVYKKKGGLVWGIISERPKNRKLLVWDSRGAERPEEENSKTFVFPEIEPINLRNDDLGRDSSSSPLAPQLLQFLESSKDEITTAKPL
jgi:hypothetical protein